MSLPLFRYISASETTIVVTGPITNVLGGGLIQIGSEVISFTSATDTAYKGCTRGVAGSTAAVHNKDVAVTLLALVPVTDTATDPLYVSQEYGDRHSNQAIAADLTLDAGAGTGDGSSPKYLAAMMGNTFGDTLTNDANYIGGVIGADSVTGAQATTYPKGAVLGQISDGVTASDGAFVAYIDGDSAQTNAGAAFTVRSNNTVPGSGFAYGMDLKGATHDGFPAVAYTVAEMRFSNGTKVTVSGDTIVFTNAAGNKSATITMA